MRIARKTRETRLRRGLTIVNTMVAVAIISVAVIGSSHSRYFAALDSRRAAMQTTAARIASLLCESWRAVKGAETYDPIAYFGSDLDLVNYTTIALAPSEGGFTQSGSYKLVINNNDYYATLSWKELDKGLLALNVAVAWAQRSQSEDTAESTDAEFRVTTYAATQ